MEKLIIKVTPTDVQIISKPEKITAGNVEYLECEFQLDSAFDGLIVRASFDGEYRTVEGNTCFAPPLNAGLCKLGVYGYILTGDNQFKQVISPEPTKFYVNEGSYSATDKESSNPPPSELESYYQKTKDLLDNSTQEFYKLLIPLLSDKLSISVCKNDDEAIAFFTAFNEGNLELPILFVCGYDSEMLGVPIGTIFLLVDLDVGEPYTVMIPVIETAFTVDMANSITNSEEKLAGIETYSKWTDLNLSRNSTETTFGTYEQLNQMQPQSAMIAFTCNIANQLWLKTSAIATSHRIDFSSFTDETVTVRIYAENFVSKIWLKVEVMGASNSAQQYIEIKPNQNQSWLPSIIVTCSTASLDDSAIMYAKGKR